MPRPLPNFDRRVLVVGAGSVGARHIRNLLTLGVAVSVFRYRQDKVGELQRLGEGIRCFSSLEQALASDIQAVVVANRPDQHIPVALAAAKQGCHLFIEKPLSSALAGLDHLKRIVQQKQLVVEIGCMMRFHPNLIWIRDAVEEGRIGQVYGARAVVGQYLPDWRPTQNYRETYSASARQGGGAVLDLVHELDYLVWWLGLVDEVSAFLGQVSDLEITSEDLAQILLRFRSGVIGQVHMDYVRRGYYRSAEVIGSGGTLYWNAASDKVVLRDASGETPVHTLPGDFERNTMFLRHMEHFLRAVDGNAEPAVPLEESIHVQEIAMAAHRSSKTGRVISPNGGD